MANHCQNGVGQIDFRLLVFLFIISFFGASTEASEKVFRLHLSQEPSHLDPNKQRTSSASYLLGNLYRNIFFYDNERGLVPDLGEKCLWQRKYLLCTLKKDLKWSDGSALTARDFIQTYQKILTPTQAIPRADLLFWILHAEDIYKGALPPEKLGVQALDNRTLRFEFEENTPFREFEYHLSLTTLAPTKKDLSAFSGPYKIKSRKPGQNILLESNSSYPGGFSSRPAVEFVFVEEDTTALQLYEKKELQFLRRLPTLFITRYKERPDFHWIPMLRMDYLGFGPELKAHEDVRKALTYSLQYEELQKIFFSEGRPGCIGLPDSWFPMKAPCVDFDLKKIPPLKKNSSSYTFLFSALGGEDHKRATEWMQSQWRKHAGLNVSLEVKENKIFLQQLQQRTPALFRKGVSPDRPTCLAALETFAPNSPENYIQLRDPQYEKFLVSLAKASSKKEQEKWCLRGTEWLLQHHLIIPLGPIHFSILAQPDFSGWKLNQMNQLDLSDLRSRP
ncbi:MAG: peptide ABC transporter substrate-binding protein [Bdellovibrio sp.]